MNKEQKQEVIDALKDKFSQYSNFYITDTQNLSVSQITDLRRHCYDKQVEMKVAKNTLIKKALESLDNDRYSKVYDSLHQVTALMFSDSPKDPALIISSFRKSLNGEKPVLKAAFLNGDIFVGDNQLVALTKIKTKNELIGEVIGLLMSPVQRVIGALQNKPEAVTRNEAKAETPAPAPEVAPATAESKVKVAEPAQQTSDSAEQKAQVATAATPPATEAKAEVSKSAQETSKSTDPKSKAAGSDTEVTAAVKEAKAETTPAQETPKSSEPKDEVGEAKAHAPEVKTNAPSAATTAGTPESELRAEESNSIQNESQPES